MTASSRGFAFKLRLPWGQSFCGSVSIPFPPTTQRAHVVNEVLPDGNGTPDQIVTLSRKPVVPKSVRLIVSSPTGEVSQWTEIDDLLSAGPEVQITDPKLPDRK